MKQQAHMNNSLGILNKAIEEFMSKSQDDVKQLRNYIREKYNISVSESALKKRMQHLQK